MVSTHIEVLHLGHKPSDDIYKFSPNKCVDDFLIDCQIFFLLILCMPTRISEMPYFRIIALLFVAVKFYHYLVMCMKYDNNTVKTISMMGVNGLYSVLGDNNKVLCTKYGMNLNNIMKV